MPPATPRSSSSRSAIFPEARHFVSRENVQYEFSSSVPPVVRVDQGDLVHVQTNDCFHGMVQPDTTSDFNNSSSSSSSSNNTTTTSGGGSFLNGSILNEIPRSKRNPITGPIYVNGARPGDILAVTLLDIRPRGIGIACCGSSAGQLCGWMKKNSTTIKFFDLSRCGTIVTMRDFTDNDTIEGAATITQAPPSRCLQQQQQQQQHQQHYDPPRRPRLGPISFPASPMLGVIGVAPSPENDPIGTIPDGKHGGNLDNNSNRIGSTVYLPVNHPGALLSMGDMHASQGDGEISGTGIEIGGDVLLRCRVLKQEELYDANASLFSSSNSNDGSDDYNNWKLEYPVTETKTHWITHGVTICDIPETTSIACREAAKILVGQWGFTLEESFIFLSVKGDLGICQACHPDVGTQIAKMSVPKLDNLCPRAFRMLS